MCLTNPTLTRLAKWNWDGETIVNDCVVPSSRPIVGSGKTQPDYLIDVREFLVTDKNAVMRQTLDKVIPKFIKKTHGNLDLFKSRAPFAFDYRAAVIEAFVASEIKYADKGEHDPWQFPDETLALKSGDCEDRAFLIASLLLASGISGYNVRVALGSVVIGEGKKGKEKGHAWVMYKAERGYWMLIEPFVLLPLKANGSAKAVAEPRKTPAISERVDYVPKFLFNADHLWSIDPKLAFNKHLRKVLHGEWMQMDLKFAGYVHQSIVNKALDDVHAPVMLKNAVNSHFSLTGKLTVEDMDMPWRYNPIDHFDNGYIKEGWDKVKINLAKFAANAADVASFAAAAHSIADFYAHSSYLHFARVQADSKGNLRAEPYDPANPTASLVCPPDYGSTSPGANIPAVDLTAPKKFTTNKNLWQGTDAERLALWKNKLISGRFGQISDATPGLEWLFTIPPDLRKKSNYPHRGSLPHHNEIAVDDAGETNSNKLYEAGKADQRTTSRHIYANQFEWRKNTAIEHIKQAFIANYHP